MQLHACIFFLHTLFPLLALLCLYLSLSPQLIFQDWVHRFLLLGMFPFHSCYPRLLFYWIEKIFRFLKSLLWRLCIILVHIPMVFDVFFWFLFMLFIMNDSNYTVMLKFTAIIYLVLFCDKHSNRAFVNLVYCKYRLFCKVGWTVVFIFHYSCTHF